MRSTVFTPDQVKPLTADADAVADRLAAGKNVVKIGVPRIDDDRTGRLVGRIFDGPALQVGPHLVPVVGRSIAQAEPSEWIGRCLRSEGARGNDDGGDRRKTAQLVHGKLPFPCLISRPRSAKVQIDRKNSRWGPRIGYRGAEGERMTRPLRVPGYAGSTRSLGRDGRSFGAKNRASLGGERKPRPWVI